MEQLNLKYDKNITKIILPNGITEIPDETFMDYVFLEEIIIPNTVEYIGKAAFKGCKALKKINLPSNLTILDEYAFSECESLEEITIPSSLHYFSFGLFSHCHNLKKVNCHDCINYIEDIAFLNCNKLEQLAISKNTTSIGKAAFMGCNSIKKISLSKKINNIGTGAFALMTNLEKINVEDGNLKFFTEDDGIVLISKDGCIIQYAINCDCEDFFVGYYITDDLEDFDGNTYHMQELIYDIADYAFAGAKKLKKLSIPSELNSIGPKTFLNCDNLKELTIYKSEYGENFSLLINKFHDKNVEAPFENITVESGIKILCDKLDDLFKNAKIINLPDTLEQISSEVFAKCQYLKHLDIPNSVNIINQNTFYPNTEITLSPIGTIKAKDFNFFLSKTNEDYYKINCKKNNVKIYSLTDGTYYVKIDDYDMIKITKDEIIRLSKNSNMIINDPDELIIYLINLLSINQNISEKINYIWIDENLKKVFLKIATDNIIIQEITDKKISHTIREIIENSGIHDEFFFNAIVMLKLSKEDLIKVISSYNKSINRFFKLGKNINDISINIDKFIRYCELLEKYQKYDQFLYNLIISNNLSYDNQELLIKYFNKNIKRLLVNSEVLEDVYGVNINDLINLCNALGVFNDDKIFSQQITTFLNEKMFNKNNSQYIVGKNIHSIFSDLEPKDEINYEFIRFFLENFEQLIELEKETPSIIVKIYKSFEDISKTSTSHKGSQRHLKVTIQKCIDYFLSQTYEKVTEKNKELALFLQKYYTESNALAIGEMLVEQSKCAPRNIFTKINYDDLGNPIYSYDSNEDLYEHNDNFSYHWLPKQAFDNLTVGKNCNCCAHLLGSGAGFTRASMILDNCQNLVIRNSNGEIIAKMFIYVNRKEGYAVFNTVEINIKYNKNYYKEIYEAFMRGVNAFIDKYNDNNDIPISLVTIGTYRNELRDYFGNIKTPLLSTPNYSTYGYFYENKFIGKYEGDCQKGQILVLKK